MAGKGQIAYFSNRWAIALERGDLESIISGFATGDADGVWPREAGVAQLVEHDVANVVVVGSNPITRS